MLCVNRAHHKECPVGQLKKICMVGQEKVVVCNCIMLGMQFSKASQFGQKVKPNRIFFFVFSMVFLHRPVGDLVICGVFCGCMKDGMVG